MKGFLWFVLGFTGFYWVYWVSFRTLTPCETKMYLVRMDFTGVLLGFMGFTGFYWVLLGFDWFSRINRLNWNWFVLCWNGFLLGFTVFFFCSGSKVMGNRNKFFFRTFFAVQEWNDEIIFFWFLKQIWNFWFGSLPSFFFKLSSWWLAFCGLPEEGIRNEIESYRVFHFSPVYNGAIETLGMELWFKKKPKK